MRFVTQVTVRISDCCRACVPAYRLCAPLVIVLSVPVNVCGQILQVAQGYTVYIVCYGINIFSPLYKYVLIQHIAV